GVQTCALPICILAGFARAANEAGGSSLQTLHETLRNVANTVNGEPFKSRLVNVLRAAHDAMNSISEKAGPAFDRFFANFSSTFASGLRVVGTRSEERRVGKGGRARDRSYPYDSTTT